MKTLAYIVASLLILLPFVSTSQSSGIDAALSKGSAADLGVYFAAKVDVSILNDDQSLPGDQAVIQLSSFFSQNIVKGYKRAHYTAAANGRSSYSLGDLYTSTGNYRIYLYFDSAQKISEIRIEK